MLKKILSCALLAIFMLTCLAGCGKDDGVPDGMYSVTIEGEPFILYVPEGWTDNRDSGISSAYYSLPDAVMASARYYTPADGVTLEQFVDDFATSLERLTSFEELECSQSALGKKEAIKYKYKFDKVSDSAGGTSAANVTVSHYFAQHGKYVVVLSLYCDTSSYKEEYMEMFEQIRTEFVFCDKKVINHTETDKKTPSGMKKASFDNSEYVFYVPTTWVCNMSDKMTEAYFPESGNPNVSVTSFSPDGETTPERYFAICEEEYQKELPGYKKLDAKERKVAGCRAVSYTYTVTYGGATYKLMQTVFVYNDLVYSVTYTALEDSFDAHLGDVGKMLDNFRFR